MSKIARRVAPTLALLAMLCSCKDPSAYTIRIKGGLPPSANGVFYYNDQPITMRQEQTVGANGAYVDTMILEFDTDGVLLTRSLKSLSVKLDTPCGPLTIPVRIDSKQQEGILDAEIKRIGKRIEGTATLDLAGGGADRLIINVDRRDEPTATIAIGSLKLDPAKAIPAKGGLAERLPGEMYEIVRPTCKEGQDVLLADKKIGTLFDSGDGSSGKAPGVALIDAKGGHCYEATQYFYAPGGGAAPPLRRTLEGLRVYTFPYAPPERAFLAECPNRLDRDTCIELRHTSCR